MSSTFLTGATISGRYTVQRTLGAGAMASVYLARDLRYARPVALKVLRADLAQDNGVARFLEEIGTTARLSHPHILPLLDSGEVDGVPFYVMPYVDGESLRDRLTRDRVLPPDEALHVAADVADALSYAHAQGVLHRDVKPENVLFSGRHALVADFGIARAIRLAEPPVRLTQAGVVVGTPLYMSPEQAAGRELDGRSDVYSLGVVLYELLAGSPPITGRNAASLLSRRLSEEPPSLGEAAPNVPPIAQALVMRALARDPDARFDSAADFLRSIEIAQRHLDASDAEARGFNEIGVPRWSIAVLPFENLSPEPGNDFLADGITEEVLAALARRPSLRVCARNSSFAFRGRHVDARTVGRRLGVKSVLSGTIRRSGTRVRIAVQLVSTADGFQVWSERYERTIDEAFALEDDISGAIISALDANLGAGKVNARPAPSPEAHEHLLRGRFQLARRTESSLRDAVESFRLASERDPTYAAAHAAVAEALALLGIYGADAPDQAMRAARFAARRALELDPANLRPQAVLGLVAATYDWDWGEAEDLLARSAAQGEDPSTHLWLASNVLTPLGRFDDALDATGRALRLDPLSLAAQAALSSVQFYARRYGDAITSARELLAREPAFALAHHFIGQAESALGHHAAAVESCERACELSGGSAETAAALAFVLGQAGDRARAGDVLAQLEESAGARYVSPTYLALGHLGLGNVPRALDLLDAAARGRSADLCWLGVRPAWDALRDSPRVAQLLNDMRLPPFSRQSGR